MTLLIYVFIASCSAGVAVLIWSVFQGFRSRGWPEAKGVVVNSRTISVPNNSIEKIAHVRYRYIVRGNEFLSNRISLAIIKLQKNEMADNLLEKYPTGSEVVVHYHPIFHGFSVLEVGPKQPLVYFFSFCFFWFFRCLR